MSSRAVEIIFIFLLTAAASSFGGERQPPSALADKGKRPTATMRYYDIPHEKPDGKGRSGEVCKIRFIDPYFGYLSNEEYSSEAKEPLGIECFDSIAPNMHTEVPVRYDDEKQEWIRAIDIEIARWSQTGDLPVNDVLKIDRSIRVYSLNNVNSKGYAYTVDPWTGEESTRTRRMHYCLIHEPKMLCGKGDAGLVRDGPKGDLTSYGLAILRSIEFLDKPSTIPIDSLPEVVPQAASVAAR
jgi:hypothetical protein